MKQYKVDLCWLFLHIQEQSRHVLVLPPDVHLDLLRFVECEFRGGAILKEQDQIRIKVNKN